MILLNLIYFLNSLLELKKPFIFDENRKFLPVCLMTNKVDYFKNIPLFAAGYGSKTIKNARNLKTIIRVNKSSSAGRGFFTQYVYDENYGKPAYTLLDHFKPGRHLVYEACTDDPKHPGEARDFTLCTNSSYNSVCSDRQWIYLICLIFLFFTI